MINAQTVAVSVASAYGIGVIGFLVKQSVLLIRQRLGEKKFNRIVKDCRIAVAALWDCNKELGLEKLEREVVEKVLGTGKYKDLHAIEEAVKKVMNSMNSMADDEAAGAETKEENKPQVPQ